MKLDKKRKMEEAMEKISGKEFVNLISPLTKEHEKNEILKEAAKGVCEGSLKSDKDIRKFIIDKDRELASSHDKFKLILKIAPIALVLFILFMFLIQSFYL